MRNFYSFLQKKLGRVEEDLYVVVKEEKYKSFKFYFYDIFVYLALALQYLFFGFLEFLIKFFVLIFKTPKEAYEILVAPLEKLVLEEERIKKQMRPFPEFVEYHKKARLLSNRVFGILVVAVVVVSVIVTLIFPVGVEVLGATYTFTQTNWSGGGTASTAAHPTDSSNWTEYSSIGSGITTVNSGADLELASTTASVTKTSDTDFSGGTFATTTTVGAGSLASVKLSKALHINEYTIGALSNIAVTASSVTANSNGTWTVAFSGTPNLARLFKNDKFTDSASKAWKVLSVAPSVYKIIVVDSEGNNITPATGAGTVGRWYASIYAWEAGRQGDLVARNAIERGLPYYDGTPDTTAVTIDGWTTDATHYIEIYVPLSERHRGKWDTGKYRLEVDNVLGGIELYEYYARIEGLQIKLSNGSGWKSGIYAETFWGSGEIHISSNIIRETNPAGGNFGIRFSFISSYTMKVWNNIIDGFGDSAIYGIGEGSSSAIYNNTISNCGTGFWMTGDSYGILRNNITQNCGNGYHVNSGNWHASSNYNISDLAGDAPGANSKNSTTVAFVDSVNKDFHLAFNDTAAKNAGADLSADVNLPFNTDIDGNTRSGTWDIGADDVGATLVMPHSIGTASRDFSTLQAWENARDGVLTTRNVFKIASQSGAFTNGETVTGTSGATGTYIKERDTPSASETYMTVDKVNATAFVAGETLTGGTSNVTATLSAILTTAGTIEKGEAYKDSTFTAGVTIQTSTTDANHYMWLTAEPGSRHTGVAGTGVKIEGNTLNIINQTQYSIIEWMEVFNTYTGGTWYYGINYFDPGYDGIVRNNIVHSLKGASLVSFGITMHGVAYNNIVYGFSEYGIYGTSWATLYNNTLFDNDTGIDRVGSTALLRNNISASSTISYDINGGAWNGSSSNNISSDATAPGTGSLTNKSVDDLKFVSTASDFIDLHIMDGSVAKDAGTTLSAVKSDIDGAQDRSGIYDIGADEWFSSSPVYNSSGTFTSGTIDLGGAVNFDSLTWNPITQSSAGTTLKFQLAANNDNSTWNYIGQDGATTTYFTISGSSTSSSLNSSRYLRYKAYLSTSDSAFTPQLDDLAVNYSYYATSSPYLTSSPYNSNDATNILGKIAWTATTTSGTEMRFQVRSSPDNITYSQWCGESACDDADYFAAADNNIDLTSGHPLKNGGNDKWLQYKAIFVSTGVATPTLGNVTLTYVVNAPPVLSTPAASQRTSDGKVVVDFTGYDVDTATGTAHPNQVSLTMEYWNGSTWVTASSVTGSTGWIAVSANSGSPTSYQFIWDAKTDFGGTATTTAKIRVTANDGEGANNTTVAQSADFSFDTKNPVATLKVDGTYDGQSGAIAYVIADDNTVQCKGSNNSDYSADGLNANSGQWVTTTTSTTTWDFASSEPVKIYSQCKDAYQNTITLTSEAPITPANIVIRDSSDVAESQFREFISWDVSTSSDFASYKIYRSTDGTNYSLLSTITDINQNFLTNGSSGAWLTQGTTYYYKVLVLDSDINNSRFSSVVSDVVDGQGGTDVTSPTISSVSVSAIRPSQATITWTTDELSDSVVYYSTNLLYGNSKSSTAMVTSHSVTLTGLSPSATYNIRLASRDPSLNSVTNDASSPGTGNLAASFSFTTAAGPVISSVSVSSVSGSSATVVWNTNVDSDSFVEFSVNSNLSSSQSTGTTTFAGGSAPLYGHSVTLTGLTVDTKYYFKVRSTDSTPNLAQDDNGGAYYTFTTVRDVTAPIISSVSATLVDDDSAVITWVTNELSDSQVMYGVGSASNPTALDTAYTTSHSVGLSSLSAQTAYSYQVISRDRESNQTTSATYTFTTTQQTYIRITTPPTVEAQPSSVADITADTLPTQQVTQTVELTADRESPTVINLQVSEVTESSVRITWETDEPATSLVEYGETTVYGFTQGRYDFKTSHDVTLQYLHEGTDYNYRIKSFDNVGNFTESANKVFKTLPAKESIEQKIAKLTEVKSIDEINTLTQEITDILATLSDKILPPLIVGERPDIDVSSSFAVIKWSTDRPSGSVVAYSEEKDYIPESYVSLAGDAEEQATTHSVLLANLKPGTTYHFQLRSKALVGGVGKSKDFTFTTKAEAGISDLLVADITTDSVTISWKTTVPATTQLEYGLTSDYANSKMDDAFNISHIARLTNLSPGTLYRYRVGGVGQDKKQFFSPNLTFVTEALPSLLDVNVDSVEDREVSITWYTDVAADSTVVYTNLATGKTTSYGDKQFVKNHQVQLEGLEQGTEYKLHVVSKDEKGNEVKSSEYSFATSKDVQAPLIFNVQTQSAIFSRDKVQTIISWRTDEPATSQVIYQEGTAKDPRMERQSKLNTDMSTTHTVVFTNFKPGAIYRFHLENVDQSGNAASSKDFSILTPQREETVFDLIIQNFRDIFRWTEGIQ